MCFPNLAHNLHIFPKGSACVVVLHCFSEHLKCAALCLRKCSAFIITFIPLLQGTQCGVYMVIPLKP